MSGDHDGGVMTALEKFQQSDAWDARYNLPTCPEYNNPFLYMAYADLVIEQAEGAGLSQALVNSYFDRCQFRFKEIGLFNRWPDGSGGLVSYDEIMGAAYFGPKFAVLIHDYLEEHGGIFNNTGEDKPDESMDIYRFIFMRPYLLACCGFRVSLWDQLLVALNLLLDCFSFASNGGKLKNYLLIYKMKGCWLVQLIGVFWRWQMKRHGCTFKTCLSKEPGDRYPIFGELAKDDWII
jgi:hypothetical protein